jgi:ABC-2 type transport system permease protein
VGGRGYGSALDAVYVMAYRQLKRFVRAPSRIITSIVNPIIWIVFFGLGWAYAFKIPGIRMLLGGVDYLTYLVPGVIAMSVFTGGFMSGISVIFDRQFGFLKEVLVAPTPRWAAMLGRTLGDGLIATLQAALIALLSIPLVSMRLSGLLPALAYAYMVSVAFAGMGILLAAKVNSHEAFQMIMSFLLMPMLFLSGAFYPIKYMPAWMKVLAYLDPLTYGVDSIRYLLTGVAQIGILPDTLALLALDAAFLAAAAVVFERMTLD